MFSLFCHSWLLDLSEVKLPRQQQQQQHAHGNKHGHATTTVLDVVLPQLQCDPVHPSTLLCVHSIGVDRVEADWMTQVLDWLDNTVHYNIDYCCLRSLDVSLLGLSVLTRSLCAGHW